VAGESGQDTVYPCCKVVSSRVPYPLWFSLQCPISSPIMMESLRTQQLQDESLCTHFRGTYSSSVTYWSKHTHKLTTALSRTPDTRSQPTKNEHVTRRDGDEPLRDVCDQVLVFSFDESARTSTLRAVASIRKTHHPYLIPEHVMSGFCSTRVTFETPPARMCCCQDQRSNGFAWL
jgi:hypothetical protein